MAFHVVSARELAEANEAVVQLLERRRDELAEEMLHTPGLSLKAPVPGAQWLYLWTVPA